VRALGKPRYQIPQKPVVDTTANARHSLADASTPAIARVPQGVDLCITTQKAAPEMCIQTKFGSNHPVDRFLFNQEPILFL
jgi:hypothetical protein